MLKALVGMSASMFTTIYVAAFRPDALSFLFFIALGPAVLGLLAVPFLDVSSEEGAACAKDAGKGEQPVGNKIWLLMLSMCSMHSFYGPGGALLLPDWIGSPMSIS